MFQTIEEVEEFLKERDKLGIKPGLDRVHFLLDKLEHPEQKIRAVHVSGTNGKGSTIQFLQEALRYNGQRVGVFTSPSFTGICGHFLINGEASTADDVILLVNQLVPYVEQLDQLNDAPTTFELITVMAFVYFKKQVVDIALIEAGMGGRFDTTNCFTPEVAIITNVAMDHMQFLGETLPEIAWHKAGIIKQNRPVVLGKLDLDSLQVVEAERREKNARIYQLGKDFACTNIENQLFQWTYQNESAVPFSLSMLGAHQIDNAAVALMTLFLLQKQGLGLQQEKVVKGIEQAVLPGRFEQVCDHPSLILDSAHNLAGVTAFVQTLETTYPGRDAYLLFAGFKDKQLTEMLQAVEGHFKEVMLTTFEHKRAASIEMLQEIPLDCEAKVIQNWRCAIDEMLQNGKEQAVFCITGSLDFITQVREYVKDEKALNL